MAYRAPIIGQYSEQGSISNGDESDAVFYDARSCTDQEDNTRNEASSVISMKNMSMMATPNFSDMRKTKTVQSN